MKILVPTDFSDLSKIAVNYTIDLCKDFELEMVLLHVINTPAPKMARLSSKKLKESIKKSSYEQMNNLVNTVKKDYSHDIKVNSYIVYNPYIDNAVESFAKENNIDLICIGTKGATGLKKVLFGSNAAGIISSSTIPVLTIPEFAIYDGVDNIIYSCDLENPDEELKRLAPLARLMNAWIHILHINMVYNKYDEKLHGRENELREIVSYDKIKATILDNNSIIDGINQYVADIDADMVAMFTRQTSLVEKLFQKSITKMAAFQAKTPLLTFQKK